MYFSTKEAAAIVGCTLRQVQYWRTKGLVVPVVNPEGTGYSAYYDLDNLLDLAIVHYLVQRGYDLRAVEDALQAIRALGDGSTVVLRWDDARQKLLVEPWSQELVERMLREPTLSLTVIPVAELRRQMAHKIEAGPEMAAQRVSRLLQYAGWGKEGHRVLVQYPIRTTGRRSRSVADFVLCHRDWGPIGVVEVKAGYLPPEAGLAQARRYASLLGVRFAFASNGLQVVDHDLITGATAHRHEFPTPQELWQRLRDRLDEN